MLTLLQLAEKKKTKVKINPSQKELTEKKRKSRPIDKDEPTTCESVDLTEEWINASVEVASEYFYAEGINEDGLDNIINEVGLEDFVEFVIDPIEELNEERSARKASVKAPSYDKVKAKVDATDKAKKKAGKGEYSKSYAKRSGETEDSTNYNDKAPAKKKAKPVAKATVRKPKAAPKKKAATVKKVEKAVKTAKKTQPKKPTSKKGLLGKVGDAVKKGVERHNKARAAGREPEKRVKEFAKGFKKGVTGTVKFAKKLKKAVSEGNQRDPEGSKKDRTHSKQPDPSKDGFTGIGNMSIKDIMKMNSKIKAKSKKESVEPEDEMVEGVGDAVKKGVKRHKDAVEKKKIKNRKAVPYAALAAEHQPEGEMVEAKVDKGRSDYGKASIRNYRRSGPGHGEPAMFDSENKRGKTIDKRREEHKARRGVKGAKVPAYKVNEHHTKDKDGKVIEHEDTTPSSVEEGSAYGIWKGDGKRKLPGDKKKAKKKEMKEAAPLAAVAAKVAGKVAAKKVVASTAGKAAVRGGIKVGGKSGGKFVKKQATKIVQNKVEKKVNQALGNEQQNEEVSRRSKPSNKAKMAKLDAILKRREERKVLEKQNALKV